MFDKNCASLLLGLQTHSRAGQLGVEVALCLMGPAPGNARVDPAAEERPSLTRFSHSIRVSPAERQRIPERDANPTSSTGSGPGFPLACQLYLFSTSRLPRSGSCDEN